MLQPIDADHPSALAQSFKVASNRWTSLGSIAEFEALAKGTSAPNIFLGALSLRAARSIVKAATDDREHPAPCACEAGRASTLICIMSRSDPALPLGESLQSFFTFIAKDKKI